VRKQIPPTRDRHPRAYRGPESSGSDPVLLARGCAAYIVRPAAVLYESRRLRRGGDFSKTAIRPKVNAMITLTERDVRAALDLVYDAASFTGTEPFPPEFLQRLSQVIPADSIVGYSEVVVGDPCYLVEAVEIPADAVPPDVQEAGARFHGQDPLSHDASPRGGGALKLSDFHTRRELEKLDFYHYVWKPLGIDDRLRLWLPAPAGRARTITLERGKHDFSERDRSLLELLQPALIRLRESAARRRASRPELLLLTQREEEILGWIARGKTTREIAVILVVSPHTVRKHIEHILEKLEVPTRSAAVARAFPSANGASWQQLNQEIHSG
jgi:DNA-binding CsgD family transcriptional regulator